MGKQLTREEILNAAGVYLYMEHTLYVEIKSDKVYALTKGCSEWVDGEKLYEYMESSLMMSYLSVPSKKEAADLAEEWSVSFSA